MTWLNAPRLSSRSSRIMSEQNQHESRKLGCGGYIIAMCFLFGIPTLIYGFIGWVIHWYQIQNQL